MSRVCTASLRMLLLAGGLIGGITAGSQAAEISWIATTGDFTTGTNWSSGSVPTVGDTAVIANGGTATLTLAGGVALEGPQISLGRDCAGTLAVEGAGSASTVGPAWVGYTTAESVTAGAGTLTIGSGASLAVLGGGDAIVGGGEGALGGSGSVSIAAGGEFIFNASGRKLLVGQTTAGNV